MDAPTHANRVTDRVASRLPETLFRLALGHGVHSRKSAALSAAGAGVARRGVSRAGG
jgi:hypothetical protein